MAKRVVMLAVAGAGKTYHICNAIDPSKKNLILAYTHENVRIINKELMVAFGKIPQLTSVMTFSAFLNRLLLRPYEPSILRYFGRTGFTSKGITTINPPPQQIKVPSMTGTRYVSNPKYKKKDSFDHYIDPHGQYYCDNLSELIMEVKEDKTKLIKKAGLILNSFFDQIMIDEFQDYRENDFDLIMELSKYLDNALYVGDFYQHSVSATNNSGRPFTINNKKTGKKFLTYDEYKALLSTKKFDVDETTLNKSRRCSKQVCELVREKLKIEIYSHDDHESRIIWVSVNPEDVLDDDSILKLVSKNAKKYSFNSKNWSYSKGGTVDKACVILTKNLEHFPDTNFPCDSMAPSTLNELYVALTRTRGDLYIMTDSIFSLVRERYLFPD